MKKTLTQGIKKVILEYVMSSVKFPPHLYNTVAIMKQLLISANTPCNQMLLRASAPSRAAPEPQTPHCPQSHSSAAHSFSPPGVNAALTLPAAGVTPLMESPQAAVLC